MLLESLGILIARYIIARAPSGFGRSRKAHIAGKQTLKDEGKKLASLPRRTYRKCHPIHSWRDENPLRQIVGVVADVRYFGLGDADGRLVYVTNCRATTVETCCFRTCGSSTTSTAAITRSMSRC